MQGVEIEVRRRRWRCGEIVIDPLRRRLARDGEAFEIDQRAFDLIVLLAAERERDVDRREIIAALWGARPIGENTLRQVVYKARRALGDDGGRQTIIRTVRGRSLRWVAPIVALPDHPLPAKASLAHAGDRNTPAPPARLRQAWSTYAALAFAALLGVAVWAWPRQPNVARVAILPIDNATGEASLDWTRDGLPGLLSTLLEADGVSVIDPHRVAVAWRHAPGARRDEELRQALGAAVVVVGHLNKVGVGAYELDFEVRRRAHDPIRIAVGGERPGAIAAQSVSSLRRALDVPSHPMHASTQASPMSTHTGDSTIKPRADSA